MFDRAWKIATAETLAACGACGKGFDDGEPYQELTIAGTTKCRCLRHALGQIDEVAIDRAKAERAAVIARNQAVSVPPASATPPQHRQADRPRGFTSLSKFIDRRLPTGDRE